jgi:hypothetical protein
MPFLQLFFYNLASIFLKCWHPNVLVDKVVKDLIHCCATRFHLILFLIGHWRDLMYPVDNLVSEDLRETPRNETSREGHIVEAIFHYVTLNKFVYDVDQELEFVWQLAPSLFGVFKCACSQRRTPL